MKLGRARCLSANSLPGHDKGIESQKVGSLKKKLNTAFIKGVCNFPVAVALAFFTSVGLPTSCSPREGHEGGLAFRDMPHLQCAYWGAHTARSFVQVPA